MIREQVEAVLRKHRIVLARPGAVVPLDKDLLVIADLMSPQVIDDLLALPCECPKPYYCKKHYLAAHACEQCVYEHMKSVGSCSHPTPSREAVARIILKEKHGDDRSSCESCQPFIEKLWAVVSGQPTEPKEWCEHWKPDIHYGWRRINSDFVVWNSTKFCDICAAPRPSEW